MKSNDLLILGSHVSLKGEEMFLGSVQEALSYGANALMVYTGPPQSTIRRPISEFHLDEAFLLLEKNHLSFDNLIVHAPYIINLASSNPEKREFGISFLASEIKRCQKIKASQIVLHPGNAIGISKEEAISLIASSLNEVLKRTKETGVKIALETMSGKGNEIGSNFDELQKIIDLVTEKTRISICFDTCHTHDAGYDIKNNFDLVINEFDKIIGIAKISVFHINDSKNIIGSKKDRHQNIGFGEIGLLSLQRVVHHPSFLKIPKILETPFVDEKPVYKEEIAILKKINQ